MSLNSVIDKFCSHENLSREHNENSIDSKNTDCSLYSQCSHIYSSEQKIKLFEFIRRSSRGFGVDPDKIIYSLLSSYDEEGIVDGSILEGNMREIIYLWIKDGMLHISGK